MPGLGSEPLGGALVSDRGRQGLQPTSWFPHQLLPATPAEGCDFGFAQYGERCWETDILPAAVIEVTIDAEINSRLNLKLWQRRDAEIERARKLL
jgi:hypothetical protein